VAVRAKSSNSLICGRSMEREKRIIRAGVEMYRRNLVPAVGLGKMLLDEVPSAVTTYFEEQAGPIISVIGVGWAVYHGTYVAHDIGQGFTAVYLKSGPLELCAIGILLWLHGKWRRSTNMNR